MVNLKDNKEIEHIIHGLERFSYLKLSEKNTIMFDCESRKNRKIAVMTQWN